ncbi:TlpA disulfide reductase family protein [Agaribacterium haliotis]|uniref:TlpA disulfide reductase family protein n=1 Tax=Agaribacterium haliotis TaxID=2013869 RepID=UPI000BB56C94|nr:TlpA disulfide reductase family protein [Agaribacterium haliotis]
MKFLKPIAFSCLLSVGLSSHANSLLLEAADFTLPNMQSDNSLTLSDYRGNIIFLDFWASWCRTCIRSFPFMKQLQAEYGEQGLQVIAINMDQDEKQAHRFLKKYSPNFLVARDSAGTVAIDYGVQALPTSFLISREGEIILRHKGFRKKHYKQLQLLIEENL